MAACGGTADQLPACRNVQGFTDDTDHAEQGQLDFLSNGAGGLSFLNHASAAIRALWPRLYHQVTCRRTACKQPGLWSKVHAAQEPPLRDLEETAQVMLDIQYAHALLHEEEAAWEQVLSDRRLAQSLEVMFLISAA